MRKACLSKIGAARAPVVVALLFLSVAAPGVFARTAHHSSRSAPNADIGVCLATQASLDDITAACTRVIALNRFSGRDLAQLLGRRGDAYIKKNDYRPAIADYTEVIRLVPDFFPIYYNRGLAYQGLGDLQSALADFLEVRRLAPDNPEGASAVAHVQRLMAVAEEEARRLAAMSSADIAVLQERLRDGGCYGGGEAVGQAHEELSDAIKACPSQDPVLRIETGTHTAPIRRISADAQCRILATASDDKTTRIWSASDGRLLRTLRRPIDSLNGGKGRAVAVSPDGRYVVAAGSDAKWDATHQDSIYVFDASTGALVARPAGFNDVVKRLVFSPDGRWLAAVGGGSQSGVRVYDTTDWRLAMSDLSYNQRDVYAVAFGPEGALYVAGFDGGLRRYSAGPLFAKELAVAAQGGSTPFNIATDPRGELVVVGFEDVPRVSFFDARTLRFYTSVDARGSDAAGPTDMSLAEVSWSHDGERLSAAGSYHVLKEGRYIRPVITFDRGGRRLAETNDGPNDTIYGLTPCGSGMALVGGSGFGILDQSGTLRWWPAATADMRGKLGSAFTIAPDARQVRFGLNVPGVSTMDALQVVDPVSFDLTHGTLSASPELMPGAVAPDTTTLPIDHWLGETGTTLEGRPLGFDPAETSRALAIRPHRDGFVLGTAYELRAFARDGSERWEVPAPSEAWGVNVSADGLLVVAAYGDGTIRWHRWSDGKELLALFVDKADRRWVAWTPSGYYMASPGGEDLIGWHVNRGWNQAADFFPASRFRKKFSRPDIVRLVLDTLDEGAAVEQANATAQRKEDSKPLLNELPPVIAIKDPMGGTTIEKPDVTIGYTWRSPSGQPVERISVLIDGRPVKDVGLPLRAQANSAEVSGTVRVSVQHHESEVGLIAWVGDRASEAAEVKLVWNGGPPATGAAHRLYALVVGVSSYAQSDMMLHYAAKDANDFASALSAQKGGYYSEVQTRLVTDHDVTRAHLLQGLKWLNQVAKSPDDVSVLFLAGHGLTDAKQTYWFLPSDASGDDYDVTGVSQEEIRRYLQNLPGKVVWFLDTCHAGSAAKRPPVDMNVLVNNVTAAENGGIVAFSSSRGQEVSVENGAWQNGAFTKALIEGIQQGKADLAHDGKITTSLLDFFLERRVQELTEGKQNPVMGRPPEEPDFIIARSSIH